jgi:hypothetical protein
LGNWGEDTVVITDPARAATTGGVIRLELTAIITFTHEDHLLITIVVAVLALGAASQASITAATTLGDTGTFVTDLAGAAAGNPSDIVDRATLHDGGCPTAEGLTNRDLLATVGTASRVC